MIIKNRDLFIMDTPDEINGAIDTAICVTTNGVVKKDGTAVMGAGVAKIAANTFIGIDNTLGENISLNGNHAYYLGQYHMDGKEVAVMSFPTKNNFKDPSPLNLVIQSCKEISRLCYEHNIDHCRLPLPGAGLGGLPVREVVEAITPLLDDRFEIDIPDKNTYQIAADAFKEYESLSPIPTFGLLVVGSRSFNDYNKLQETLDALLINHTNDNVVIVSGGARGADTLAERYAKERGYELEVHPADWDTHGRSAGYIRNAEMHKRLAEFENRGCVAFWDGQSKGTQHNFDLAKKYNTPLRIISCASLGYTASSTKEQPSQICEDDPEYE